MSTLYNTPTPVPPAVNAASMLKKWLEAARVRGDESVIEGTWGPVGKEHVLIVGEVTNDRPWPKIKAVVVTGWDAHGNAICGPVVYRPVPKHVAARLAEVLKTEVLVIYKGRRKALQGEGATQPYHNFTVTPLRPEDVGAGSSLLMPDGEVLQLASPAAPSGALQLTTGPATSPAPEVPALA